MDRYEPSAPETAATRRQQLLERTAGLRRALTGGVVAAVGVFSGLVASNTPASAPAPSATSSSVSPVGMSDDAVEGDDFFESADDVVVQASTPGAAQVMSGGSR